MRVLSVSVLALMAAAVLAASPATAADDLSRLKARAAKVQIGGGIGAEHVAQSILFAYKLPQNVLIQEICITPTRQEH